MMEFKKLCEIAEEAESSGMTRSIIDDARLTSDISAVERCFIVMLVFIYRKCKNGTIDRNEALQKQNEVKEIWTKVND